jgi:hypothetical protein
LSPKFLLRTSDQFESAAKAEKDRQERPLSATSSAAGWPFQSSFFRCMALGCSIDLPPEKWTPGYAAFASACCGVM